MRSRISMCNDALSLLDVACHAVARRRAGSPWSDGSLLDPLFVLGTLENVMHESTARDDMIGIDRARLDELLDLGNGDTRCRRHHRIEIPGRSSIDQIAYAIAFPGVNEREVGTDRSLEHMVFAVDQSGLFPFGDDRTEGGRREESANAGAAGANPLGKGPLRDELDLEFAGQILSLELLVLADVGRNHSPDLSRPQQNADAEIVDAGVVADDGQIAGATRVQRLNEVLWNAAQTKAAHQNRCAVRHQRHIVFRTGQHFVHGVWSMPAAEIIASTDWQACSANGRHSRRSPPADRRS